MPTYPTGLFFWPGQFLYIGPALNTHSHEHHSLQLLLSLNRPFQLRAGDQPFGEYTSVLIAPDASHECRANDSTVAFLDPDTRLAQFLSATYLTQHPIASLPEDVMLLLEPVKPLLTNPPTCLTIGTWLQSITNELVGSGALSAPDERISQAQALLQQSLDRPPSLAQLADAVCLSPGRLVHLFKAQVGIPIRRYVLWERLLVAIRQLNAGVTLTQAAHQAGFSDQAHFSRTFTRMFGLSPSLLAKGEMQVKVCG